MTLSVFLKMVQSLFQVQITASVHERPPLPTRALLFGPTPRGSNCNSRSRIDAIICNWKGLERFQCDLKKAVKIHDENQSFGRHADKEVLCKSSFVTILQKIGCFLGKSFFAKYSTFGKESLALFVQKREQIILFPSFCKILFRTVRKTGQCKQHLLKRITGHKNEGKQCPWSIYI